MVGESGRHLPVRAEFQVAEEAVWVTGSYEKNKVIRGEVLWGKDTGM